MAITLKRILIDNFKSYSEPQWIEVSDMSVFMGANSSGKSTALQTLLALKQTMECESPNIDLLLSGKYITLGDYKDIVNDNEKEFVKIGAAIEFESELTGPHSEMQLVWSFTNIDNQPYLHTLDMDIDNSKVSLTNVGTGKFSLCINEDKLPLLVDINNLKIATIYTEYDVKYNVVFYELLTKLLYALSKNKKSVGIKRNRMMSTLGIDEFYVNVINSADNAYEIDDADNGNILDVTAQNIIDIINSYAKVQFVSYKNYLNIPEFIQRYALKMILKECKIDDFEEIDKIIKEYSIKLEELLNATEEVDSEKNIEKIDSSLDSFHKHYNGDDKESSGEFGQLIECFLLYDNFYKEILAKIFYLGPIREKPKGLYNIGFEAIPKYVGITGAYFASVLLHQKKTKKQYLFPNNVIEETELWDALDQWVTHLNIASEVYVEQKNSFGFSVSVENMQCKKSDIMNVGIGTSQVLPVLITGLLSEKDETLIFEQPELHLHPYSQSRLADFFVALAKNGRKVIIETHSEYMLLRLRYHVMTESLTESELAINFFQNSNGTIVRKGKMNSYGNLEYPDDFKDETQELLNELVMASIMKGKKNENKYID